jgi:hypothetical protein
MHLFLYMAFKRKVSYSHYSHIQSCSVLNCINATEFYVPWVCFFRVLMFVQHTTAALVIDLVGEMKSPEKVMLVLFGLRNNNIWT